MEAQQDATDQAQSLGVFDGNKDKMQHFATNIHHDENKDINCHMTNSYESSVIFPRVDHLSCHHQTHFNQQSSNYLSSIANVEVGSDVYKHPDNAHPPHHQALLIDDDDYDLHKHLTTETELIFRNISHSISTSSQKRTILSDISGYASPGQILVVMGPSGSGKTTLLNTLSGRVKPSFGEITLNGQKINKQLRRRICYVLQQDIFFPSLTLKQTLMYTARLRLPESIKNEEKQLLVDKLIEELQLKNCQDTIIGDVSNRGLSGGEKKRANIACELLTNPSIMLIDEPTSGLDSCTAFSLVQIMKNFALKKKKTVVMTIHQPSSQMFYMFDQLLLLSEGCTAYFGNINQVIPFFNNIGFMISLHYNPADFILEKVKSVSCQGKIIEAAKKLPKLPKYSEVESIFNTNKHGLTTNTGKYTNKNDDGWKKESLKSIELHVHEETNQLYTKIVHDNDSGRSSWSEPDRSSTLSANSFCRDDFISGSNSAHNTFDRKWATSTFTQIKVLTERNFIEAKHRMLSKLNWIQTIVLGLIAGLIWFQVPRSESTLDDIRGWMFFTTTYWMLFGLFQALVSFPSEREVINKERSSGAYRLSSYYIAKMIGELPLTIALPSVFFFISYPLLGCTSLFNFVSLWIILVISTICAQSVGLFIGAACYDLEVSITLSALYSLSTMLFAGYYTSMPSWLSWIRYFSMVYYAFLNMQMIEFNHGIPIICSNHSSKYEYCKQYAYNATGLVYVPYSEIELQLDTMNQNSKPFPFWLNTVILFLFLTFFRSLGYLFLRFTRKPNN